VYIQVKMPPKKTKSDTPATPINGETSSISSSSSTTSSSSSSSSSAATAAKRSLSSYVSSSSGIQVNNKGESDRLLFAQAINHLASKSAALHEVQTFDTTRIQQIEMQLEAKKKEFADMTEQLTSQYEQANKQLENEHIDAKIKMNQEIREHGLQAANQLLASMNMTSISTDKLQAMTEELSTIKETSATSLAKAVEQEKQQAKQHLQREVHGIQLEHKANIASLQAQVEQQVKEIRLLNDTIANLQNEIAQQRNLTKEVAQASSKSQISQNFTK